MAIPHCSSNLSFLGFWPKTAPFRIWQHVLSQDIPRSFPTGFADASFRTSQNVRTTEFDSGIGPPTSLEESYRLWHCNALINFISTDTSRFYLLPAEPRILLHPCLRPWWCPGPIGRTRLDVDFPGDFAVNYSLKCYMKSSAILDLDVEKTCNECRRN